VAKQIVYTESSPRFKKLQTSDSRYVFFQTAKLLLNRYIECMAAFYSRDLLSNDILEPKIKAILHVDAE